MAWKTPNFFTTLKNPRLKMLIFHIRIAHSSNKNLTYSHQFVQPMSVLSLTVEFQTPLFSHEKVLHSFHISALNGKSGVCADHKNLACELAPAVAAWSSVSAFSSRGNIKQRSALLQRRGDNSDCNYFKGKIYFAEQQRSHIIDWVRVAQR